MKTFSKLVSAIDLFLLRAWPVTPNTVNDQTLFHVIYVSSSFGGVSNINQAASWPVHHFWGFIWSRVSSYLWKKKTFPCQINRLINHSQCRNPVADKVFPLLCFLCRRGTEVGRGWWWLRTCTTATYPQGIIQHVTAAVNSFWKSGI